VAPFKRIRWWRQQDAGRDREAQRKTMSFTTWELKVRRDPGAPERIRELGEQLRLAAGLTSRKAATAHAACDTEFRRNAN
jgi:hypothetical protein